MPRLSRATRACREFEAEIDNLLELEGHIPKLGADLWAGKQWKVGWYVTMISISAYSAWERLVEKLLFACLSTNTCAFASSLDLSLPTRVSVDLSEALLTSRSGYLDFRGTSELIGATRKWLSPNPFDKMTQMQKKVVDDLRVIRNAVVHGSRKADRDMKKRFGPRATTVSVLMRQTAGQTTLRKYLADLKQLSTTLSSP